MSEVHELEQISSNINKLTDTRLRLKEKNGLIRKFRRLIKKFRVRETSVNKDGSFYLNVSGATVYYLVALKKAKQKNNEELIFWIEKINFDQETNLSSIDFVF